MKPWFALAITTLFLLICEAGITPIDALADATPNPAQTVPPDEAAPLATPQPLLINGQIVDMEGGYVVFASGDALRLAQNIAITDAATGSSPLFAVTPGVYAIATIDAGSGLVISLRISHQPLSGGTPVASTPRRYVVAASSPKPNPDLAPAILFASVLSKTVGVTVAVDIPPGTPFNDDIFMATDSSGWNPQAIKMQRIDGQHFRIEMELRAGTEIHYLFTRGTWNTVERDRAGLQRKARTLAVPGGDVRTVNATVYRWADLP